MAYPEIEKVSNNVRYKGLTLDVSVDGLFIGGKPTWRETVHRPKAVVMVGGTQPDRVVFVEQYRHAVGNTLLELPAGKIDLNENPTDAAIREFHEETGLLFKSAYLMCSFYPSPGYSNEVIYAYRMVGPYTGQLNTVSTDEITKVREYHMFDKHDGFMNAVMDAKSLLALQRALSRD